MIVQVNLFPDMVLWCNRNIFRCLRKDRSASLLSIGIIKRACSLNRRAVLLQRTRCRGSSDWVHQAGVIQRPECRPSKSNVGGSNPSARSILIIIEEEWVRWIKPAGLNPATPKGVPCSNHGASSRNYFFLGRLS